MAVPGTDVPFQNEGSLQCWMVGLIIGALVLVYPVWILLHVLFGYTSTPEWTTLAVWAAYLATVLGLYLRPAKPSATSPHPVQRSAVRP